MKKNLLLLFFIFQISAICQDTLKFEQPYGTISWNENSLSCSFQTGFDQIRTSNPYLGSGHAKTSSNQPSFLTFDTPINVTGLWIYMNGFPTGFSYMYGYDENDNVLFSQELNASNFMFNYAFQPLNWMGIKKIKFNIPPELMPGPDPMFPEMEFPVDVYYDEIIYELSNSTNICLSPSESQMDFIRNDSIFPVWRGSIGEKYIFRFKPISSTIWAYSDTLLAVSNDLIKGSITNYTNNTWYHWQVKSICTNGIESNYSSLMSFKTECDPVLYALNHTATESTINVYWTSQGSYERYNLKYRIYGTDDWTEVFQIDTSNYNLTGLPSATRYEIQVQNHCFGGISAYTNTSTYFGTICEDSESTIDTTVINSYYAPNGQILNTSGSYIITIPNSTNCDSVITINLTIQSYDVLTFDQTVGTTVWTENGITWEYQNGGSQIWTNDPRSGIAGGNSSTNTTSYLVASQYFEPHGIWLRLLDFPDGNAYIQGLDENSNVLYSTFIDPAVYFGNYQYLPLEWGPVKKIKFLLPNSIESMEDPDPMMPPYIFPVNVHYDDLEYLPSNENVCAAPDNREVEYSNSYSAKLKWQGLLSNSYLVRYTPDGINWFYSDTLHAVNELIIDDLETNGNYYWQVKAICSSNFSEFVAGPNFFTNCQQSQFVYPPISNLTDSSAIVSWIEPDTSYFYNFRYRIDNEVNWNLISNISTDTVSLYNLSPGKHYEIQLQTNCLNTTSDFTGSNAFDTPCSPVSVILDTTVVDHYVAPDGGYFNQTGTFSFTIYGTNGCNSLYTLHLTVIPVPNPIITYDKEHYCNLEIPIVSVNCSGNTVEWFIQDIGPVFVDNDTLKVISVNESYLVRCASGSIYTAYQNVSFNDTPRSFVSSPNLYFNSNEIQGGVPSYNHCKGAEDLYIGAICVPGSVLGWTDGTSPILNQNFRPDSIEVYSFYCEVNGCNSDTTNVTWSFKEPQYANEKPPLFQSENYSCYSGGFISASGCSSNNYFGHYYDLEGNINYIQWQGSQEQFINLDTSKYVYVSCIDPVCSNTFSYDSIFYDMSNPPILSPPEIPDNDLLYCQKGGFLSVLSNACSNGTLSWLKYNSSSNIEEEFLLDANAEFYEGDTLKLTCIEGLCISEPIFHVVDYSLHITPEIESNNANYCIGTKLKLFSPNCPSPQFTSHWRVHTDGNLNYGSNYYSDTIEVELTNIVKVSLYCHVNSITNANCYTDTSVFVPQFANNTLIANIQTSKDTLCHGESFDVTFDLSETFPNGNIFTVQLSDKFGSFENAVDLGSSISSNQTSISVALPTIILAGDQYRIRVVPSLTNLGPGEFLCYQKVFPITVLGRGAARIFNNNGFNCEGSQLNFSASSPYFNTYIFDRNIKFFKNGADVTESSKTKQKDKYLITFAQNTDQGFYHVEMEYNGCLLSSDSLNIAFLIENRAPSFSDTTVSIQRGNTLNLNANCIGSLVISPSPFAFYAPYPSLVPYNFKNYADTTFYLACNTSGCISDYREVVILVTDPFNAPLPPILTLNEDSVCTANIYSNPQIVTATGCTGTIEWYLDASLNYPFETDTYEPYQLTVPYGNTVYAKCSESGIVAKGISKIDLHQVDNFSYHLPKISPANYINYPEEYTLKVGQNTPVHLEVEEYTQDYGIYNMIKYCSNGIIKWFDSENNFLQTGNSFDTLSSSSDIKLFLVCERAGKCEDKRRPINISVTDTLLITPANDEYYICGGGSVILKANSCISSNVKWFADSLGNSLLYTGDSFSTGTYNNTGTTNTIVTFYVACNNGVTQTTLKQVKVIVSPMPQFPSIQDTIVACNTPVVLTPIVDNCLSIEEPIWYISQGIETILSDELFRNTGQGNIINYDYRNQSRSYKVTCKNKSSTCESAKKHFTVSFDCSPPPPPIIEIGNQITVSATDKNNGTSTVKGISAANEFCVGEQVLLMALNCENGTIFWSDGFVGSPRNYKVKEGYINLVANCKTDNYLKSASSNSLEFQSKPTPSFALVDTVYSTSLVNLSADSVLSNLVLPLGSTMAYFSDAEFLSAVPNPANIDVSGTYFIKATAPNACSFSDDVVVIIDKCGRVIGYYSPTDDVFSGNVDAKTRKQITAENKIRNTARASFRSESNILLRPGFEAKPNSGGVFKAEIGGCDY
ncbi:3-coathanger stack domain-containing protein [Lacihabitans sp. LS3-19]|uniref:3-coathanger stack domain-containing protein n=1 Tax=Lacihabitans sp. LS3-19 TaxID=2487335 RepID=UPI0020CC4948|nr:3-coathanger stack domain-containing protein [Lacihabitans sp. LS3-19]